MREASIDILYWCVTKSRHHRSRPTWMSTDVYLGGMHRGVPLMRGSEPTNQSWPAGGGKDDRPVPTRVMGLSPGAQACFVVVYAQGVGRGRESGRWDEEDSLQRYRILPQKYPLFETQKEYK